jgi:hypothetical protein
VHTQALIEGLEVHPEAMRKNLGLTRGDIVSEAVMMGLGPMIGRQVAHDLVYDVCRELAQEKDRHCSLYIASHPLLSSSTTTTLLLVSASSFSIHPGAIVGIVIGLLVLLHLGATMFFYLRRRHNYGRVIMGSDEGHQNSFITGGGTTSLET